MKPPHACRWLENKAWFFPPLADTAIVEPSGPDAEDPEEKTTPFWCNQTQEAVGPDGDLVCLDDCTRNRRCYVPDVDLET